MHTRWVDCGWYTRRVRVQNKRNTQHLYTFVLHNIVDACAFLRVRFACEQVHKQALPLRLWDGERVKWFSQWLCVLFACPLKYTQHTYREDCVCVCLRVREWRERRCALSLCVHRVTFAHSFQCSAHSVAGFCRVPRCSALWF